MALGCRICQRTKVGNMLSIFRRVEAHEKNIADMIDDVRGSKIEEDDRLPQQVCHECLIELDQAYCLRLDVRHSLRVLLLNPETVSRCLVCSASDDEKELIPIECVHERRNTRVSYMIEQLIGEHIREISSKYVCVPCRIKVDFAYEMRKKFVESESMWLDRIFFPWEKMEVDDSNPEHLVFEVYAEVVRDKWGSAHCSVCLLSVDSKRHGKACEGCKLEFRKGKTKDVKPVFATVGESSALEMEYDEVNSKTDDKTLVRDSLDIDDSRFLEMGCAEEVSCGTSLVMECTPKEEKLEESYESPGEDDDDEDKDYEDDGNGDDDDSDFDTKYSSSKVAKSSKWSGHAGYVEEPEKVFDIVEAFAGDPFPSARRKGPCCCKCFKFFATKAEFADHKAESHASPTGTGRFSCDVCLTFFSKKQDFLDHRKRLDTFLFDYCRACKIVFEAPVLFQKHKAKNHMDRETIRRTESHFQKEIIVYYKCCMNHCYNCYSTEELLQKHLEVAHDQISDSLALPLPDSCCPYCMTVFDDESCLSAHWRTEKEQFRCQIDGCRYTRTNEQYMWRHCSRVPHSKLSRHTQKTPRNAPDLKYFTVIGQLDQDTDILQRNCSFCCRCFLTFETDEELVAHRELHTLGVNMPYQCQMCKRGFTRVGLTHHNRLQEIPTNYYCRPCKTFLWTKLNYVFHKIANHLYDDDLSDKIQTEEDYWHTCCGCWNPFRTEKELIEHRQKHHPAPDANSTASRKEMRPKCDYCHEPMPNMKQLEKHISFYESKVTHSCKESGCIFRTKDMDQMRQHIIHGIHRSSTGTVMIKNKKEGPDDYRCCVRNCVFRCIDYDELIEHGQALHTAERKQLSTLYSGRQFTCPVCCKGFEKQITLYHHKLNKRKLACPGCQKLFLREELQEHASRCRIRVKCEICSQPMASKAALKKHRKDVHYTRKTEDHWPICNVCGKQVKYIKTHMLIHDDKREWPCPICGQAFKDAARLNAHAPVHSDVRKYACRQGCDKQYKYQSDRDRHEKAVHLGIKPFPCSHCSESFIRNRDLRLHERKHTGRKLYSCPDCNKGFDILRELDEHCAQNSCE